jgi:hypothetical protein
MLEVRRRADPATQNGHWEKGALGLLAALKGGSAIDGAAIVAPELQLSVRTK